MKIHKLTLTLLLALIAAFAFKTATSDTIIRTTDFKDYIDIVKKLSPVAAKLRLLKSVWAEIRCDYKSDLKAVETLQRVIYDIGTQALPVISVAQQQEIDEFYQEARQVVIEINVRHLSQIINIKTKPLEYDADNFVTKIINNFDYDPEVSYKIFQRAIDQMYGLKSPLELSEFLRSYEIVGSVENNALLYNTQLYLYWKFISSNDIDDAYLLYIAYYMFETKSQKFIQQSSNRERRLNDAIKSLPTTVQNLFLITNIRFLNVENSEYLYEFNGRADDQRNYIFSWRTPNSVGANGPFNVELALVNTTISARLWNVLHQHYLYRDQNDNNQIYAWINGQIPTNSRWSLSLNDNKLSLYQNDLYVCAGGVRDNNRRYIVARQQLVSNVESKCEWYVDTPVNPFRPYSG